MAIDIFGNYTAGTKALLRLDRMAADKTDSLEHVMHTSALENGMVVAMGDLKTGEREIHAVKVPATATLETDVFVLIAAPEIIYNEVGYTEKDFYIPANKECRAFNFFVGDVFTVSDTLIDLPNGVSATAAGGYVSPQNGSTKWLYSATYPTGVRLVCKVEEKDTLGGPLGGKQNSSVLKVVKC